MQKKNAGMENKDKILNVAPGQALGYGLQYTRLTEMLLDAPEGSFCSLEVLDDVAEQNASGEVRVCQTKSSLTGNPVSDKSVQLWKSLNNWVKAIQSGLIDINKTYFELFISKPVGGEIIKAFHNAGTEMQAKEAIAMSKVMLWGDSPKHTLKSKLPSDLAQYVNRVLEADEGILVPVILRLKLECGSGSPVSDLQKKVKGKFVSESKVDEVLKQACGWVKVEVDKLLEKQQPAVISRDKFHLELTSFARKIDRDLILVSYAPEPSQQQKHTELPRMYVQQLGLIELSFDDKLEAISDYLRACWDRTAWAKKGDVHESSFDELDTVLRRKWRNISRKVLAEKRTDSEVGQGQVVYSDCMQHKSTLESKDAPDHFIPGCYQRLADEQVVGWHPKYRDLLAKEAKKKSA